MPSFSRRALVTATATLCLAGIAVFAAPAAVAAIHQFQLDATAQSFVYEPVVSSSAMATSADAVQRDAFVISEFTVIQWPVDPSTPISSYFGYRSCDGCSTFHTGVDFVPGDGHPIEAIADGVVVGSTVTDGSWGVHVTIQHDVDGVIYFSSYAHMRSGSMTLALGDTVTRGEVIGLVGSTGQSNGSHLHFTIQDADRNLIDPLDWMQAHVTQAWGE
ncbi:MAG: M23 family metallopeptidase [Pseudolysinimonas sp.]|uniref:M23 family metallopeptidase n=1 Tax=Pseudolysinimonas sp. TaxID=2680009 RepID=UPI0032678711